jgi:hypothetical protein
MAQAGYTPISLYYSTTAAAVPTAGNLAPGELAININDGKLYYENSSGVVTLLAQTSGAAPVTSISFGSTGLTPSTATSGVITVAGTLAVANGGTGATTNAGAPFALKGANSDITSLTGLTTALSVAQGGTGATSTGAAPFALKGANSDITSLTGLTTPLSVAQGGTGSSTAIYALKGANSDITSLTGLTTPLSVAQGGTGAATLTANNVLLGNGTSAPSFVAPSTAGNVLTSNGTTWTSSPLPGGGGAGGFVSAQYFTTNGSYTWTRPAGIVKVYVYVIGAGGGGRQAGSQGLCGGGGGGCAIKLLNVTSIASAPVIVGQGGAVNGAGGASSFNGTIIGNGGGVGNEGGGYPVGGVGGSASGGDLNLQGGTASANEYSSTYIGTPGGVPAFFGIAGPGGGYSGSNGPGLYGGGGGGNGYSNSAGAGGDGIVVVYEYN